MSYDEFKNSCRISCEKDYNYLSVDRYKERDQGRYCICNENKSTCIDCTPQKKVFWIT